MFMTLEGSFEPTVVFFGLTNFPATFWTMINMILENLINTREVISFINDVIVGTERKKDHDKVVEEVVKRLVKNDFYEKCKWKIRELEVFGVVIGLEEIKIEEEKVKVVLDWLTSKCQKYSKWTWLFSIFLVFYDFSYLL